MASKYKNPDNDNPHFEIGKGVFRKIVNNLSPEVVSGLMDAGKDAAQQGYDGVSYVMENDGIDTLALDVRPDTVDFALAGETAGQIFALPTEVARLILSEMQAD